MLLGIKISTRCSAPEALSARAQLHLHEVLHPPAAPPDADAGLTDDGEIVDVDMNEYESLQDRAHAEDILHGREQMDVGNAGDDWLEIMDAYKELVADAE